MTEGSVEESSVFAAAKRWLLLPCKYLPKASSKMFLLVSWPFDEEVSPPSA